MLGGFDEKGKHLLLVLRQSIEIRRQPDGRVLCNESGRIHLAGVSIARRAREEGDRRESDQRQLSLEAVHGLSRMG